jgi:hypothetical protein
MLNPFPISSVMLYRQVVPGVVGMKGTANAAVGRKSRKQMNFQADPPSGRTLPI